MSTVHGHFVVMSRVRPRRAGAGASASAGGADLFSVHPAVERRATARPELIPILGTTTARWRWPASSTTAPT